MKRGFTLVELLVVLAIVSVLAAVTAVALQKTVVTNKLKMTEVRVLKLQRAVDVEHRAVVAGCERDSRERTIPGAVLQFCDNDPKRARAVWTAAKIRQHFPLTFADATTPIVFATPTDTYSLRSLAAFAEVAGAIAPVIDVDATNDLHESAAILYVALAKKANTDSAFSAAADDLTGVEQAKVAFGPKELTVFKDCWDRPIGFRSNFSQAPGLNPLAAGWNLSPGDPRLSVLAALEPYDVNRIVSVQSKGENPTRVGLTDDVLGELLRRK